MLVLLDIDGVMVKAISWKPAELLSDGFAIFSIQATRSLLTIIQETNASIILTTSHKDRYSLEEWEAIFRNRGIDVTIDKLENNLSNLSRKDEVMRWVDKFHPDSFVIIDDDKSLNDLPIYLKDRLVSTSSMIGLTDYDAFKAIEILNSSESIYA